MNQTPPNPVNGTFSFIATIRFEIDPTTAANLLVESDPNQTVHLWLLSNSPKDLHAYPGNVHTLRTELGAYLADKEVNKVRLLLPSGDPTKPPF